MRRLLLRLGIGLLSLTAFLASWMAADDAHAAWTPCGGGGTVCNLYTTADPLYSRYWASQSWYPSQDMANGIRGLLSIADVSLHDIVCERYNSNPASQGYIDPKCDFLGNSLMTTLHR
jgi:hypothetical protein